MGQSTTPDHGQIRAAMEEVCRISCGTLACRGEVSSGLAARQALRLALLPCGCFSVFPFCSCSSSRVVVLTMLALTKASL